MKPFALTAFALTAFAFNSILCRLALGAGAIDAASFTTFRLLSGAGALIVIVAVPGMTRGGSRGIQGNWLSAGFLVVYAVCFSFAYNGLTTATGALILFGAVQLTMFAVSISRGEKPGVLEWAGLAVAFGGLLYLVFPGLESPPLISSALMAAAGAAWGFYTLRGKGSDRPLQETTGNFIRSVPFSLAVTIIFLSSAGVSWFGAFLAVISGAVASGVGYSIWYAALRLHSSARAAVLQLSVPLIAAVGGVLIVSEPLSARLPLASILILGGILLTIVVRE